MDEKTAELLAVPGKQPSVAGNLALRTRAEKYIETASVDDSRMQHVNHDQNMSRGQHSW